MPIAKKRVDANSNTDLSSAALHQTLEYFTICLKSDYRHGSTKSLDIRRRNYETIIRLRQVCADVKLSNEELEILWYELYALRPHNKLNIIPFGQCMPPKLLKTMNEMKCIVGGQPEWITTYMNSFTTGHTWLSTFNTTMIDLALMIERTPSSKPFTLNSSAFRWSAGPMRKVRMLKTLAGFVYRHLKSQQCQPSTQPQLVCNGCACQKQLPRNPVTETEPTMFSPSSSVYSILYKTIKRMSDRAYWILLLDAVTIIQCEQMFDISNGVISFLPEERINSSFCSHRCYWSFMSSFHLSVDTFRTHRIAQTPQNNPNVVKLHADDGMVRDKGLILDNLMSALQRNSTVCSELKLRRQLPHFVMLVRGMLALDTMILMCSHQLMLTQKVVAPNIPGRSLHWRKHTTACMKQFIDNCTTSRTVVSAFRSNAIDGVLHRSNDLKQQTLVEWCRQHASTVFLRRCEVC